MTKRQKSVNRYRDILIHFLKRGILAAALFSTGFYLLYQGNIALVFIAFASMIYGAIIVAFPLAELFAEPTGNLFWPNKYYDRPQPAYSIPQSKRARGFYEEAMAGFEKIATEYPEETQPYVEMIDIAIVNLHDPKRANAIFHRGIEILKKDEDRETLSRMYRAIQTRLNSRPANGVAATACVTPWPPEESAKDSLNEI